jgi:hypothetical protein
MGAVKLAFCRANAKNDDHFFWKSSRFGMHRNMMYRGVSRQYVCVGGKTVKLASDMKLKVEQLHLPLEQVYLPLEQVLSRDEVAMMTRVYLQMYEDCNMRLDIMVNQLATQMKGDVKVVHQYVTSFDFISLDLVEGIAYIRMKKPNIRKKKPKSRAKSAYSLKTEQLHTVMQHLFYESKGDKIELNVVLNHLSKKLSMNKFYCFSMLKQHDLYHVIGNIRTGKYVCVRNA